MLSRMMFDVLATPWALTDWKNERLCCLVGTWVYLIKEDSRIPFGVKINRNKSSELPQLSWT